MGGSILAAAENGKHRRVSFSACSKEEILQGNYNSVYLDVFRNEGSLCATIRSSYVEGRTADMLYRDPNCEGRTAVMLYRDPYD